MKQELLWLDENSEAIQGWLTSLVAIPSVSTDGEHQQEIERSAELTCDLMRLVGLRSVSVLRAGDSNPYAYGEWCDAPGKPTVFFYAHHDVQPVQDDGRGWNSPPWTLTARGGRLYGRGAADDKGGIVAQLGALGACLKTRGTLPVNVKMLVEGEEEVGSRNLVDLFTAERERLLADVIAVCDTGNLETGLPCLTTSLRGVVSLHVEVRTAEAPVHSGIGGGYLADAALALSVILSRFYDEGGRYPVPGLYDGVRPLTEAERAAFRELPGDDARMREELGVLPGVRLAKEPGCHVNEQTWRKPAITIIAQEASSIRNASNQVLPEASAIVSCRIVPDQDPDDVFERLRAFLTSNPPWGARVEVKPLGSARWWMTDPSGPVFEAARAALESGFGRSAAAIGCGGSIGFIGPLQELFGGAPAVLMGLGDPPCNAHAPNESLHEGDFRKLMASLVHLLENLGGIDWRVATPREGA
jgi:acetylornithine deacetylase/succinyl-diaminopimelate desuccinylase-like protein